MNKNKDKKTFQSMSTPRTEFWLNLGCILVAFWLHFDCFLTAFWLNWHCNKKYLSWPLCCRPFSCTNKVEMWAMTHFFHLQMLACEQSFLSMKNKCISKMVLLWFLPFFGHRGKSLKKRNLESILVYFIAYFKWFTQDL